jgi:S1-C subfamily serine protease
VGGTPVGSSSALRSAIGTHKPGQSVAVSWVDSAGQAHHATITLITGPAD